MNKEKFDAASGGVKGSGRLLADIPAMKEVTLQPGLRNLLGDPALEINEYLHCPGVAFLGALVDACHLKGPAGLLEVLFHVSYSSGDAVNG